MMLTRHTDVDTRVPTTAEGMLGINEENFCSLIEPRESLQLVTTPAKENGMRISHTETEHMNCMGDPTSMVQARCATHLGTHKLGVLIGVIHKISVCACTEETGAAACEPV